MGNEFNKRNKLSRRAFIKSSLIYSSAAALVSSTIGCPGKRPVLRVANWADLIGETTINDFENKYDCRVLYENYSSNEELFSKLKLHPDAYDIIFPSDYMVEQLMGNKLLQQLDYAKLTSISNIDSRLMGHEFDPDNKYSLPYVYWGTGIAVNEELFSYDKTLGFSWDFLFDNSVDGRVTVLDELRYTIGMALIMNNISVNSTNENELEEAKLTLVNLKPRIMAFVTDVKDLLLRGEPALSYAYSGDVYQAAQENDKIRFVIPKGGGIIGIDNVCISEASRNFELVYKFLNYIMSPEVAADLTNFTYYATANKTAFDKNLIKKNIRDNPSIYIPIDDSNTINVLRDLGEYNQLYVDIWDIVMRS